MGLAASLVDGRYRLGAVTAVSRDVVVYVADDTATGRQIALEMLRDEVAADADFVAAVREQVRKLASPACAHRAIARVYECGVTDAGVPFVALERTVGRTLREVLEARGPLDPYNALRIAIQVGEALEVLHHRGIIHGELRPECVVLVSNQQVTEHAKLVGTELTTAHRTAIGVRRREPALLPYLAPEQIERAKTTESADVHALGGLLRDLLTAEPSRESRAPRPPLLPMSMAIESIIATALRARPDQRYSDVTVMLNDMWGAQSDLDEPKARPHRVVNRLPMPSMPRLPMPSMPRLPMPSMPHIPWPSVGRRELGIATTVGAGALVMAALVWLGTSSGIVSKLRFRVPVPAYTASPTPLGTTLPTGTPLPAVTTPPTEEGLPIDAPSSPPKADEGPRLAEPGPTESAAPPVAAVTRRRPAPTAPVEARAPAETRAPIEPRAPAETRPPAPRPAPRNQSATDDGDGSAIIDWLLKDRR